MKPHRATLASPAPSPPVLAYPLHDALYLNLTNRCTLSCAFCPKIRDGDFSAGPYDLRLREDPSASDVFDAARRAGIEERSEVVFTGFGESTRRLDVLLEVVHGLRAAGARRIRLDTDGLASLREGRDVAPELAATGLDAVSVSLNAADAATYARVCPSRYGEAAWVAVKAFIPQLVRSGVPEVVASAVGYPGVSEQECRRVAESLGARFRWRPYKTPANR